MNMPVLLADAATVDARGSRGAKTGGSGGGHDDAATSFDGVLSDVGTDEPTPQSGKPATTGSTTGDPSAAAATAVDPTQAASDSTTLEALMGFVGQPQTMAASVAATTAPRGTKTTDKTSDDEESVDALLKRIAKTEDDAKDSTDQPATAPTSNTDPRLDALATLVAQIAPLATAQTGTAQTSETKAEAGRAALAPVPQDSTVDTTQLAAKGTLVADIAIETHLAPAPIQANGRGQATPLAAGRTASSSSATSSTTPLEDAAKTSGATLGPDAVATAGTNTEGGGADARGNSGGKSAAGVTQVELAQGQTAQAESSQGESAKTESTRDDSTNVESAKTESVTPTPMLVGDLGSLRRIASAVVELAAAPSGSNVVVADADTQTKAIAPARTLTLQMQPADLGTVDVRLHMSSNGLDLQLGISDEHTLGMVSRERDTLTSMLQDQNYQVHSLVIQESSGGASSSSSGFSGNQGQQPQSESRADRQFGSSGSNDQSTNQRQPQGDRPAQNGRQPRETSSLRTPADPGNSLFV